MGGVKSFRSKLVAILSQFCDYARSARADGCYSPCRRAVLRPNGSARRAATSYGRPALVAYRTVAEYWLASRLKFSLRSPGITQTLGRLAKSKTLYR